jgi:hypothetical protein
MTQPLIKKRIVKKRTKKIARFQSDLFLRVKVRAAPFALAPRSLRGDDAFYLTLMNV